MTVTRQSKHTPIPQPRPRGSARRLVCRHPGWPLATKADIRKFRGDLETMQKRLAGLVKQGKSKDEIANTLESDYGWRAKGCGHFSDY